MQRFIEFSGSTVSNWESISLLLFWPLMVAVFIWYFIQGLLEP